MSRCHERTRAVLRIRTNPSRADTFRKWSWRRTNEPDGYEPGSCPELSSASGAPGSLTT
jgi:hypothetical protein